MKHPIITSLGLAVLAGVSLVNTASLSAVRTPFRTLCATLGFAALLAGVAQAQSSIGDYRSAGSGNWDTAATWESFNGTSWNAAATKPIATNSVYIQSAHTVTLTASAACMDIHFCAGSAAVSASTMGFVALGANTLAVHGKLRAYIAPVGTIPGTSTTTGFGKYPTTTNGAAGGKISIAGGSRTLTVSGEIGATVSTTTPGGDNAFPLEFNLDPGATVTLEATLKASSWVLNSGTLDASGVRVAVDVGTTGQGNVTINNGAVLRSAKTGNASGVVMSQTSSSKRGGTFTINLGGKLQLTGSAPMLDMNAIVLNGTVEYNGAGPQALLAPGLGASDALPNNYTDLVVMAGTTLVETGSGNNVLVNGTLVNHGTLRKTQPVTTTGEYTFGLAGLLAGDTSDWLSIIVSDLPGTDPLTAIQVDCIYANHPHAPGTNTTDSYWTITPVGGTFTADVILPHANLTEPEIGRYRDGAWDWGNTDFDPVTIYRTDVTAFGDFAVFNNPQIPVTTTLASSLNPSTYGASVTFTATVSFSGATGTVTFKDGATTLGTGTLTSGTATYASAALSAGSHSLTAEYAGDSSYGASTSGALSQTVDKAMPTVSTWPTASAITTVGQALSVSTLSGGSASVAGSFAWTTPATTPPAGNYSAAVTFTPTDTTNYNTVAGSVNVLVGLAAVADTVTRSAQGVTKIAVAQLLANDLDAAGRTLSISSVTAGSGGTVALSGRWITFTPDAGLADATPATFSYVLSNGTASTASATVTLNAPGATYTTTNATLLRDGIKNIEGGGKILTFAAIPNFIYVVEASDDLNAWTPLGSFTAGADGRLVITDTGATKAARFYRFKK